MFESPVFPLTCFLVHGRTNPRSFSRTPASKLTFDSTNLFILLLPLEILRWYFDSSSFVCELFFPFLSGSWSDLIICLSVGLLFSTMLGFYGPFLSEDLKVMGQ